MTTTPQPSQAFQSTATKPATNRELPLPQSDRDPAHLQGHWLLARIGKHVLRPGGTYSIHELGLQPDNLDESVKDKVRKPEA